MTSFLILIISGQNYLLLAIEHSRSHLAEVSSINDAGYTTQPSQMSSLNLVNCERLLHEILFLVSLGLH